jgi:threonine dehydrogenase-like Zn-dependent dehydrogenase
MGVTNCLDNSKSPLSNVIGETQVYVVACIILNRKFITRGVIAMTKKMARLAIVQGVKGDFKIEERELPEVAPKTLLLKVDMTGVCATDVHYWMGFKPTFNTKFPALWGHEFCGTIIEKGKGFDRDFLGRELQVGDRVVVKPMVQCGRCFWCSHGISMKCESGDSPEDAKGYGDMDFKAPWFQGGYAEYIYIHVPGSMVLKTTADPKTASLLEPLSIAVHGMDRARQRIGDTVVVQGSGPIGLLTVATAKYYGAAKVILVGAPDNRLEIGKELGADAVISIEKTKDPKERVEMVMDMTEGRRGADVVYECAGFPSTIAEGIDYLRYGGTYCEMGHFVDTGTCAINPALHLCSKMITLVGAWSSDSEHMVQGLSIIESGRIPLYKLVTHVVGLEDLKLAFQVISTDYKMPDGSVAIKIAVDPWLKK